MKFLSFFKKENQKSIVYVKKLIEMALVDGHFDEREKELLKRIAREH